MKKLLLILALLSVYGANAQNTDRIKLLADIETLSSDKYEGRKTGTQGNRMAAEYITNRFKETGLKSFNEDFKHPFTFKNRKNEEIKGINLIGYVKDRSELYAAGTYKTPVLKNILKDADTDTGINIRFGHDVPGTGHEDWTMQSDHGPFSKENIPFVYFGVEDHQDYHKPTDIYANINQDFFYSASNAILRSIISLDKSLDLINPK